MISCKLTNSSQKLGSTSRRHSTKQEGSQRMEKMIISALRGAVVETPHVHCKGHGSDPWSGSHMTNGTGKERQKDDHHR